MVAVAAAVAAAGPGCVREEPTEKPTGYVLRVRAVSADTTDDLAVREVICTIIGYSATKVVTVVDTKTGREMPYQLEVGLTTPQKLAIIDAANADRIEYKCTMLGFNGDSFHCEILTAAGRPAPVFGSIDFDLIESDGPKGARFPATCSGSINTKA